MTNSTKPRASGSASRFVLWLAVALLTVLGTLGVLAAIRANPLDSDRASNGISKYMFLEECKGELDAQVRQVARGAEVEFLPPGQIVPQITEREEGGWQWTSLVIVSLEGQQGGQAQFTCQHDRKSGKTEIVALQ